MIDELLDDSYEKITTETHIDLLILMKLALTI